MSRRRSAPVPECACRVGGGHEAAGRGPPSLGLFARGGQRRARSPVQMWPRRAQSRRRCGRGEPGPCADGAGVSPDQAQMQEEASAVPVDVWQRPATHALLARARLSDQRRLRLGQRAGGDLRVLRATEGGSPLRPSADRPPAEPSLGADVGGVSPVPVQMWAQRRREGSMVQGGAFGPLLIAHGGARRVYSAHAPRPARGTTQ
jgi:hypothetical protein